MRSTIEFVVHFSAQVGVFLLFCSATVLFVGIVAGFLFRDATKVAMKSEESPTERPHEGPGVTA